MTAVLCGRMTAGGVRRVMQGLWRSGGGRSVARPFISQLQATPDTSTQHNIIGFRPDCTCNLLTLSPVKTKRHRPVSQTQRTLTYSSTNYCTSALDTSDVESTSGGEVEVPHYLYFHVSCGAATRRAVVGGMVVQEDFVTEQEEAALMSEVEPHLKRLKYEYDHWDDAIHGFREVERTRWSSSCSGVLGRVLSQGFPHNRHLPLTQTHVLDLAQEGVIKPHVDSIRFCGDTICGLCLLSDAVMRLVKVDSKEQVVDVLLPRRSLYIMRDAARYDFTHEVLAPEQSWFRGSQVPRGRRVSIISRNHPPQDQD